MRRRVVREHAKHERQHERCVLCRRGWLDLTAAEARAAPGMEPDQLAFVIGVVAGFTARREPLALCASHLSFVRDALKSVGVGSLVFESSADPSTSN